MAQKNFSKEQFQFKIYNYRLVFYSTFKDEDRLTSINASLLLILLSKASIPNFETNLLFLKNYKFYLYISEVKYFNYFLS